MEEVQIIHDVDALYAKVFNAPGNTSTIDTWPPSIVRSYVGDDWHNVEKVEDAQVNFFNDATFLLVKFRVESQNFSIANRRMTEAKLGKIWSEGERSFDLVLLRLNPLLFPSNGINKAGRPLQKKKKKNDDAIVRPDLTGYLFDDLHIHGYSRYLDKIVQRDYVTINGQRLQTCSLKTVCTMDEYLENTIGNMRMCNPDLYNFIVSHPGNTEIAASKKTLETFPNDLAPKITLDRNIFSFHNGFYNIEENKFTPYAPGQDFRFLLTSNFACNHFADMDFNPDWLTCDDIASIPTPSFDLIMDTQHWPNGVKKWAYILFGRLLYKLKTHDQWEVAIVLQGDGGTGKSTLQNIYKKIYQEADVAIIGDNIENQFGLESKKDKFIALMEDLTAKFNLNQSQFQNMISASSLDMSVKFESPITRKWTAPILISANKALAFTDNSNSISRRLVIFPYEFSVSSRDGNLPNRMAAEIGAWICKTNRFYRQKADEMANSADIWNALPPEFLFYKDRSLEQNNPLLGLLNDESIICYGATKFIPLSELNTLMKTYAKENRYPTIPQWSDDYYRSTLQLKNLKFDKKGDKPYPVKKYRGRKVHGRFVYGIDMVLNPEQQQQQEIAPPPAKKQKQ